MALYKRTDNYDEKAISKLAEAYRSILVGIGEEPQREGLLKTPERVSKALAFMTSCLQPLKHHEVEPSKYSKKK